MKPLAMYLRKSRTDDPSEPLEETLRKHRAALDSFLSSNKMAVAREDIFEEVVSGDSLYARPEMLRLLEKVENGYYRAVLCIDIQRLGRGSLKDQGIILEAFKNSGTQIITPAKTYDLSDETDETYTEFEQFMGRQELKMILRRLKRGKKQSILEGAYMANPPYGYEQYEIARRPSLRIIESEAAMVRMMFDMYVNQGLGCTRIADAVNSMGARPRRSNSFGRTTVMTILSNPVYIGKIAWNRKNSASGGPDKGKRWVRDESEWLVVDGLHEPIIEKEIFEKAQEIRKNRGNSPTITGKKENPLAGLVRCGNCGAVMQRQYGNRGGYYLMCSKKGCMAGSKLSYIEEAILAELKTEASLLSGRAEETAPEDDNNEATLKSIEANIEQAKKQLAKLQDLLEREIYDIPTYTKRKHTIEQRIIKFEKSKKQFKQQDLKPDYTAMEKRISGVISQYDKADPEGKNTLLKTMIETVRYSKEKNALPYDFQLDLYLKPIY